MDLNKVTPQNPVEDRKHEHLNKNKNQTKN